MPATPLIGRYKEFDLLRERVDQLLRGQGDIILISGERGMGKSFLVRQVYQNLMQQKILVANFSDLQQHQEAGTDQSEQEVFWLQGWCSSYERQSPFFFWQILLKSWLGADSEKNEAAYLLAIRGLLPKVIWG